MLGADPADSTPAWRSRIGVVLQTCQVWSLLTVRESLELHAGYYPSPRAVDETMALAGLGEQADQRAGKLSGGQQRRLDVALALIGDPELLFLDEPTTGFDPAARRAAWEVVASLRELGKTVFLTTHYMDEAEHCDRIAIVDHGKIVALDTPSNLKAMVGGDVVVLRTDDNTHAADEIRARFDLHPEAVDGELRLEVPSGDAFIPELVRGLSGRIATVAVRRPTLDDVFLKLTGRAIRDAEASSTDAMREMGRMWGARRR